MYLRALGQPTAVAFNFFFFLPVTHNKGYILCCIQYAYAHTHTHTHKRIRMFDKIPRSAYDMKRTLNRSIPSYSLLKTFYSNL